MLNSAKANVVVKKSWVTPELKKTDIDKITAHGSGRSYDGAVYAS